MSKPKDLTNKFNKNNKQSTTNLKVEPTNDEIQKQIRELINQNKGRRDDAKESKSVVIQLSETIREIEKIENTNDI